MTAALAERPIAAQSTPAQAAPDAPARGRILGLNDRVAAWVKKNPRLAVFLFLL